MLRFDILNCAGAIKHRFHHRVGIPEIGSKKTKVFMKILGPFMKILGSPIKILGSYMKILGSLKRIVGSLIRILGSPMTI